MINSLNKVLGIVIFLISMGFLLISKSLRDKITLLQDTIRKNYPNNIPSLLVECIILIEDIRFFDHYGIDFYSIGRAIKNNILKGRKEGASTITQQLVRVITSNYDIKYSRKVTEIILASIIDNKFSKQQIINGYCYNYHFENCIGVTDLCNYENMDINNLLLMESCIIAARFKYPYLRTNNYVKYLQRVRMIEIISLSSNSNKLGQSQYHLREFASNQNLVLS